MIQKLTLLEEEEKQHEEKEDSESQNEDNESHEDEEDDEEENDIFKPMKYLGELDENDFEVFKKSPTLKQYEKEAIKLERMPDQGSEEDNDSQDNCNSDQE